MPGQNYAETAAKLRQAGLSNNTPCAIVSRATTPRQETHRTNIGELHHAPNLPSPTLLIVGEVVRFADSSLDGHFSASDNEISVPALLADYSSHGTRAGEEEPLA